MSMFYENLKGCRASKNRDEVLAVMERASAPLTIDEIYLKIKKKKNSISLSTIYRIIDKLSSLNIVRIACYSR